nr:Gfo/Idh/MocA family oxidoreductase [Phytoactinopolyspora alkaliphila]
MITTTFADRDIELVAAFETDPVPGTDWCAEHGVPRAESAADAIRAADAVLVLAPDNLDTHRAFAQQLLPSGRRVVFDKLLAPNPTEAWQIVELAERHEAAIFSGSGLRYAAEVEELLADVGSDDVQDAFARGYGRWDHYGIHTLSLAVRLGGHRIRRVRECGVDDSRALVLDHGDRRTLVDCRTGRNAAEALGWTCGVKVDGSWRTATVTDAEMFYTNLLRHYLDFFADGAAESTPEELARLASVLAASQASLASGGEWIEIGRPNYDVEESR